MNDKKCKIVLGDELDSLDETAKVLGISYHQLYYYCRSNNIPVVVVGKRAHVRMCDLKAMKVKVTLEDLVGLMNFAQRSVQREDNKQHQDDGELKKINETFRRLVHDIDLPDQKDNQ